MLGRFKSAAAGYPTQRAIYRADLRFHGVYRIENVRWSSSQPSGTCGMMMQAGVGRWCRALARSLGAGGLRPVMVLWLGL